MTHAELKAAITAGTLKELHNAKTSGYVSRKNPEGLIRPYLGKFGTGFKVLTPRWDSSRYCTVTYYVYS